MDVVSPIKITQKVIDGIYNEVTTVELDNLAAETAAQMSVNHPDYAILAARIAVSNLHKETKKQFSDVITDLYNLKSKVSQKAMPLISKVWNLVIKKSNSIKNYCKFQKRSLKFCYFKFLRISSIFLSFLKSTHKGSNSFQVWDWWKDSKKIPVCLYFTRINRYLWVIKNFRKRTIWWWKIRTKSMAL